MLTRDCRRSFLALFAVVLLLAALGVKCWWDHVRLTTNVAFAEEQTEIFDEMRLRASQSDPAGAVRCLDYVLNYYLSGTKQGTGSRLDRLVERARRNMVAAILADLRSRTGQDFGDDPQRWIDQFGGKE